MFSITIPASVSNDSKTYSKEGDQYHLQSYRAVTTLTIKINSRQSYSRMKQDVKVLISCFIVNLASSYCI